MLHQSGRHNSSFRMYECQKEVGLGFLDHRQALTMQVCECGDWEKSSGAVRASWSWEETEIVKYVQESWTARAQPPHIGLLLTWYVECVAALEEVMRMGENRSDLIPVPYPLMEELYYVN